MQHVLAVLLRVSFAKEYSHEFGYFSGDGSAGTQVVS